MQTQDRATYHLENCLGARDGVYQTHSRRGLWFKLTYWKIDGVVAARDKPPLGEATSEVAPTCCRQAWLSVTLLAK